MWAPLTNPSSDGSGAPTTNGGSQKLSAGWNSPKSVIIKIDGTSSVYDADLLTVVASPSENQSFPTSSAEDNRQSASPSKSESGTLKVLSMNSFVDSVGYLHVVGEIQNDTPNVVTYLKATGTFYDNNNKVVATDFTFTNPSEVGPGDKAPFEIILTSASIPLSQIDHYRVVPSYQ